MAGGGRLDVVLAVGAVGDGLAGGATGLVLVVDALAARVLVAVGAIVAGVARLLGGAAVGAVVARAGGLAAVLAGLRRVQGKGLF